MFKKKSTKDGGKTFFVRSGKWRNWSYKMSEEEAESLEKAMYQETFGLDLKNIKK